MRSVVNGGGMQVQCQMTKSAHRHWGEKQVEHCCCCYWHLLIQCFRCRLGLLLHNLNLDWLQCYMLAGTAKIGSGSLQRCADCRHQLTEVGMQHRDVLPQMHVLQLMLIIHI